MLILAAAEQALLTLVLLNMSGVPTEEMLTVLKMCRSVQPITEQLCLTLIFSIMLATGSLVLKTGRTQGMGGDTQVRGVIQEERRRPKSCCLT